MVKFIDKDGNEITQGVFNEYIADDSYRIVRQFQNEKIKVVIEWVGKIENADALFPSCYPLFVAYHFDAITEGNAVKTWKESIESGKVFAKQAMAIKHYEEFLTSWSESYIENGELCEVGNLLAPVIPPAPDAPLGNYNVVAW